MKFPQIKHRSWIAFYLITLSFMTGYIYAIGLADAHFMSAIDVQRISRYLANRFAITDNLP